MPDGQAGGSHYNPAACQASAANAARRTSAAPTSHRRMLRSPFAITSLRGTDFGRRRSRPLLMPSQPSSSSAPTIERSSSGATCEMRSAPPSVAPRPPRGTQSLAAPRVAHEVAGDRSQLSCGRCVNSCRSRREPLRHSFRTDADGRPLSSRVGLPPAPAGTVRSRTSRTRSSLLPSAAAESRSRGTHRRTGTRSGASFPRPRLRTPGR